VSGCCAGSYVEVFDEKQARKDARRYRRKGLPNDARFGVDFLRERGLKGLAVLEIGGGVGAAQIELLRAGASAAVNVELSLAYEGEARALVRESGLPEDSVERRVGDFVEDADSYEPADAVLLNRVVCCYPDCDALVGAAAARARRYLVLTYPPDHRVSRFLIAAENWWFERRGREFRSYIHPHALIHGAAEANGLRLASQRRGTIWHAAVFERVS
jgi:hypothetical protein